MHKSEAIEDLRVRRTRKLLQQAFIECTIEKGFAALTVRDITERAMVNRSTFYRHYLDKYDLLEQYINEMLALLEDQEERAEAHLHDAPSNLIDLLKHVQQEASFYRVMLGAKADSLFEQRFCQKTEKRFISYFNQAFSERMSEPDAPPLDLKDHIIAAAGRGAIVWWLDQEQSCSPEQLADFLNQFIYDISVSSLKLKGEHRLPIERNDQKVL
jgi:AcrR family transcriptional regulator